MWSGSYWALWVLRVFQRVIVTVVMRMIAGVDSRLARLAGRAATVTPEKVNELYHDDWVCRDNPVTELTGWRPKVDIDEGMRLTLGWYLGNGWL